MKFFCEYCGNMVDANVDKKCPNCGASYKKNKSFIKLHEENNKEVQQTKEFKQQVMNHALGVMKVSKWITIVPIIIFIIVLSIIIFGFININKSFNNKSDNIKNRGDSFFNSQIEKKEPENVTVNFNEFGQTNDYKVKVEKYEVVKDTFNRLDEGYEYVKFYLIVENLTDDDITKEDVNCIVDGIAQTNKFSSGYSDIPMFISRDLTVKGNAIFEVPKNATSYDIKYGDYITIHIEK